MIMINQSKIANVLWPTDMDILKTLDGMKQKCRTNDEDLLRKGRLSYDRHWGEREASVERVLNEVKSHHMNTSLSKWLYKQCFHITFAIFWATTCR